MTPQEYLKSTNLEVLQGQIHYQLHHLPLERWSVQGFGFMRAYIDIPTVTDAWPGTTARIHLWDKRLMAPGGSRIHTHPWSLDSLILAGVLQNQRYMEQDWSTHHHSHWGSVLRPGENADLIGKPKQVCLLEGERETYFPGQGYHQDKDEIHESIIGLSGTVTLCIRQVTPGNDPDYAWTYWAARSQWNNHRPRPATEQEYHYVRATAIQLLRFCQELP